jgi:tRNA(Ile)-lysidine synthase
LDHGLRETDAELDRALVEATAAGLGLPLIAGRADCRRRAAETGVGLEAAARAARYEFLLETAGVYRAKAVATGHTADDNAESVLLNLLRGSGPRGLAGIPPVRGRVIRPLMGVGRQELLDWLDHNHLPYRIDQTNFDLDRTRNRVRHRLVPFLAEAFNPRVRSALVRTAAVIRDEDNYMDRAAREAKSAAGWREKQGRVAFRRSALAGLDPALARRLIRMAAESVNQSVWSFGLDAVETVRDAAASVHSVRVSLPAGLEVVADGDRLSVGRPAAVEAFAPVTLDPPGRARLDLLGLELTAQIQPRPAEPDYNDQWTAYLDWDRVRPPLTIRPPRAGDRFRPLGLAGSKKLSDFLIDEKVPTANRPRVPVVADRDRIVWIGGRRPSDAVKIRPQTTVMLVLRLTTDDGTGPNRTD